ncbi:hypothetical protein OQA88_7425 [Cercophora sp. LCS_1]
MEYQYTPLPTSDSIRIVVLLPSTNRGDIIRCKFTNVFLGNEAIPKYEALSYTWGYRQGSRPILCEGKTILVTPNCEQALLHLRRRFRSRHLWVDAICINQQSVPEKNTQVPLMGDIYRHASRTIMWLGVDTDPELSGLLRRASRYGAAINRMKSAYRAVTSSELTSIATEYPILNRAEKDRLARLLKNDWFHRMWTLQEFLLSESPVFRLGGIECGANDLLAYSSCGHGLFGRGDLDQYFTRNQMRRTQVLWGSGVPKFIADMVQLASLNHASDARDKVYGMMAWIKHCHPSVQVPAVDYAVSAQHVFERFTRCIIATTQTLSALEFINTRPQREDDSAPSLPSWVLDLRHAERIATDWKEYDFFTNSLSRGPYPLATSVLDSDRPSQLPVCGKKMAVVRIVSSRMPFFDAQPDQPPNIEDMDYARTECLSEWTALAAGLDLDQEIVNASPYRSGPNPYVTILEKMTEPLDYLRLRHEPLDPDTDTRKPATWEQIQTKVKQDKIRSAREEKTSFIDGTVRLHDMCALFVTSTGHLGECQGDVLRGDEIYILQGAEFPFVLRQACARNQYTVVGKANIPCDNAPGWDPRALASDPDAQDLVLV